MMKVMKTALLVVFLAFQVHAAAEFPWLDADVFKSAPELTFMAIQKAATPILQDAKVLKIRENLCSNHPDDCYSPPNRFTGAKKDYQTWAIAWNLRWAIVRQYCRSHKQDTNCKTVSEAANRLLEKTPGQRVVGEE